ncbi:hypothetical protein ACIP5Y_15600 [Nocardia sp. NPDC088792]|uniref:hypothetical protein n=1 Tax=Nocardia sp. NPDC088792 TaxID=3364332 RepID=UPI00380F70C8
MAFFDIHTVLTGALFLGGTGVSALFAWMRARKFQPIENMRYEVAAAKDVNEMALTTLSRVSSDLKDVTVRLDAVEAAQEASIRELNRVTGLFREALGVLRGVIDAARAGRIPDLNMSRELMDEVQHNAG